MTPSLKPWQVGSNASTVVISGMTSGPTVTVTAAVFSTVGVGHHHAYFQVSARSCRYGVGLTHTRRGTIQQLSGVPSNVPLASRLSSNMDPPMHVVSP